jgi:hypothetical protein
VTRANTYQTRSITAQPALLENTLTQTKQLSMVNITVALRVHLGTTVGPDITTLITASAVHISRSQEIIIQSTVTTLE